MADPPPTVEESPQDVLEQRQSADALRRAVERLPPHLSDLYLLRARGMSYEELSAVLDVPVGTVKSRVHEMVRRLREEIEQ